MAEPAGRGSHAPSRTGRRHPGAGCAARPEQPHAAPAGLWPSPPRHLRKIHTRKRIRRTYAGSRVLGPSGHCGVPPAVCRTTASCRSVRETEHRGGAQVSLPRLLCKRIPGQRISVTSRVEPVARSCGRPGRGSGDRAAVRPSGPPAGRIPELDIRPEPCVPVVAALPPRLRILPPSGPASESSSEVRAVHRRSTRLRNCPP